MYPVIPVVKSLAGGELLKFLLDNRKAIVESVNGVTVPIMEKLTNHETIVRLGGTIVSIEADQQKVVGILQTHTTSLAEIAKSVDAIEPALDFLKIVTSIGVGFSALSQVHIALQFRALTKRLQKIEQKIDRLHNMLSAGERANLDAGIGLLEMGDSSLAGRPSEAEGFFNGALIALNSSTAYYTGLVSAEINSNDHAYLWMLTRHLLTSVQAQAAAHLRLKQPSLAKNALRNALKPLISHAEKVFHRTVGSKPTAFLMPELAKHGVTLEILAELYRQASHAGILENRHYISASEMFEELRTSMPTMRNPKFYKGSKALSLKNELIEAGTAVEEINRLRGLILLVEEYGERYPDLAKDITNSISRYKSPFEGEVYAVFPTSPSS